MATEVQEFHVVGVITYFPNKVLGKGAESRVYDGKLENGRNVAVKRIKLEFADTNRALQEIEFLLELDGHENVVTFFAKELQKEDLFIALERCDLSLKEYIEQGWEHFYIPKPNILKQMTKGMQYLHSKKIIHRDLKPGNILLLKLADDEFRIKISDFDISKELIGDQTSKTDNTGSGTREWMAPEILRIHQKSAATGSNSARMSPATDIFSLGCIFYYVLTGGDHPFGKTPIEMQHNIAVICKPLIDLKNFDIDHVGCVRMIQQMLSEVPKDRPLTSVILTHHLFWSKKKTLDFLVSVSNAAEAPKGKESLAKRCIELADRNSLIISNSSWMSFISPSVKADLMNTKHRKSGYNQNSIMDLVRALRNLNNHHSTLPAAVKQELGSLPDKFTMYWIDRFPFLVDHIWTTFQRMDNKEENGLAEYYPAKFPFSLDQQGGKFYQAFILHRKSLKIYETPNAENPKNSTQAVKTVVHNPETENAKTKAQTAQVNISKRNQETQCNRTITKEQASQCTKTATVDKAIQTHTEQAVSNAVRNQQVEMKDQQTEFDPVMSNRAYQLKTQPKKPKKAK